MSVSGDRLTASAVFFFGDSMKDIRATRQPDGTYKITIDGVYHSEHKTFSKADQKLAKIKFNTNARLRCYASPRAVINTRGL